MSASGVISAGGGGPAREETQVGVVATFDEPPTGRIRVPVLTEPQAEGAAAFRVLRHRLQALPDSRVFAVTSPGREEGKTTCALNLALAFAEHGLGNVLLVEANLQQPVLAQGLGFLPPRCFAEQMQEALGRPSYQWSVVATYLFNLHVLAVNPNVTSPTQLKGAALTSAMSALRGTNYSRIILDCPSVFGSADVSIIESCVDGLLMVGRAGMTRSSELKKAAEYLQPVTLFGSVLMGG